jgi:L-asparaginase
MRNEKKILLITTGGTIGGESISKDRISNKKDNLNFQKVVAPSLDRIQVESNIYVSLESFNLCQLDSSNILPTQWTAIGNKIYEEYNNYDAFLITHGTNTLGYTSAALAFSFENLSKPIILTGSQVPFGNSGSDAVTNLENAIRVAVGTNDLPINGVLIVFGSHIITGVRAKKTTEFDYDAFQSFTTSSLGRIGRTITLNRANLEKHLSYLSKYSKPAVRKKNLKLRNDFDTKIVSLTEFPGMSSNILTALVDSGIKGIIMRSFGAGDASNHLEEGFQYLKAKKVPIVVTTQAPNGVSSFQVNEPGQRLHKNRLAIPAWDMSIESQTTKLSWLLGQGCSYEDIMAKMIIDYRGEINVKI